MEKASITVGVLDRVIKESGAEPDSELIVVDLTSMDLNQVMADLLKSSASVPGLRITPDLRVIISSGKGSISGKVSIDHSAVGHSEADLDLVFGNSQVASDTIVAEKRDVRTNLSIMTKLALKAAGIDLGREIGSKLSDPHKSIFELMKSAFKENGRTLDTFGANFAQDKDVLVLGFKSRKS